METTTIVMSATQHAYARTLAPTFGFQGIALPIVGQKFRQRPATSRTDLRHRTP
ncbi:ABC-type uncharacterized transport system permease subunit [Cellulomonas iranensis]|uniref:ABC-type uncharacterized transport system permease subunit n=1 Tax=Cellulomonas iranensis TaxID=76862 RepID=A0ABU0GMW9_9CELL|nr:ABC-type uncharacterized transport system permease subunit [Cellulomonas iranensis]